MFVRKAKGGSSIGPYSWPEDGSVCEVPDELAADLLADPDWGYTKAGPPVPAAAAPEDPGEPESGTGSPASGDGKTVPRRTRKAPAKPPAA